MGRAYYNEYDPPTAAWLRELIKVGLIADGDVDERSIEDVTASDVQGYTQAHFFAGIGGWSYALRLAGWPDERGVWTGSCPCQPFSSAGAGRGDADPRDLWPAWFQLIRECRPHCLFGEQVEAAARRGWLDRLSADLEGEGYAVGAVVLGAHSVGAFHIRQRLWFVANAEHAERRALHVNREDGRHGPDSGRPEAHGESGACREVRELADAESRAGRLPVQPRGSRAAGAESLWRGEVGELGHADDTGSQRRRGESERAGERATGTTGVASRMGDAARGGFGIDGRASRNSGHTDEPIAPFWSDADWIPCRDSKSRPVERGTFPLAARLPKELGRVRDLGAPFHAAEARVMRLKGYGNAIVPQVAAEVIAAYMEASA